VENLRRIKGELRGGGGGGGEGGGGEGGGGEKSSLCNSASHLFHCEVLVLVSLCPICQKTYC